MQPFTDARAAPLSIGVLSPPAGVHIETVRYYERVNTLVAPPRTRGGRRAHGQSQRRALSFIGLARDLGPSLDETRALLDLDRTARASCQEVREIASLHLANVRAKLADLARRRQSYPRRSDGVRPTFTQRVLCSRFKRPIMRLLQSKIFASRESSSKMAVFERDSKDPSVHRGVGFGVQL
jgi:MerR family mercuric resistance operon transcriptional regulator